MAEQETPWLVQRVMRRTDPLQRREGMKGVDLHFRFSYMGSSEFEFGALKNSIDAMRSATVVSREMIFEHEGELAKAYYVGREQELEMAQTTVEWALTDSVGFKERPLFRAGLFGDEGPDGWWAVQQKRHDYDWVPFIIFSDEDDATLWKRLLEKEP